MLNHIAIVMDGNNRWAKQRSLPGPMGHKKGVQRIRDVLAQAKKRGVTCLTLFAFSSENWKRPSFEVTALMKLFDSYLASEVAELKDEGVELRVIGSRERFSKGLLKRIEHAESETKGGELKLVICADYGGQWDIAQAAKQLALDVQSGALDPSDIDAQMLSSKICLNDLPDVDLIVRTGGEYRISNFLLWQSAYSEFFFTDTLWPDFDGAELDKAIDDFHTRERRFGMSGDQLKGN